MTTALRPVLVVEDNDEDFEALQREFLAIEPAVDIERVCDGDEALERLQRPGAAAGLSMVVLDLNLPGTDGREVLETVKRDPALRRLPVVILSTSGEDADIEGAYSDGANAYVQKPLRPADLRDAVLKLKSFWLGTAVLPQR